MLVVRLLGADLAVLRGRDCDHWMSVCDDGVVLIFFRQWIVVFSDSWCLSFGRQLVRVFAGQCGLWLTDNIGEDHHPDVE